ncbi:NAD-dependent epimerase/dehydratase family protein [Roseicella aerolata]|uniref:NAD-dependent epimerase/dehydratase family protein n=1 Tax=Roseicella aerolata TaxID=2883479 RepID=A0A9X1IJ39_9PROT|nr:NAD-dependent epimerase/dehydratase family protein [Roseicella aerolata]MCB4825482.1 NAD-dependent epimerase/dehydratase family protein [Roseicella aerolata]
MTWHVVTGGAGFIGANLVRRLVQTGGRVVVVDDLSLGRREHLAGLADTLLLQLDAADAGALAAALRMVPDGPVEVWHLCANSDIQKGVTDPSVDLRATFLTTFAVLEVMRTRNWRRLHFASTSAVYGDHGTTAIHELTPTLPVSNYGAMKLASEAIIRAACETFLDSARVFRFPNVVGLPATHGAILDFTRRLIADPQRLAVLGNGMQQKAYLHVAELVDAMLFIRDHADGPHRIYNIGPEDAGIRISAIAEMVRSRVAPAAAIAYGTEARGWVGDVPRFRYDVSRLKALGWAPRLGSAQAVARAVDEIAQQEFCRYDA